MNNFISSLSIYEFLRILMPGAYLTLNVSQFIKYVFPDYDTVLKDTNFNQVEATIIFAIMSIIFGVFIYSLDNPRLLSYVFKNLPSNIIKAKHTSAENILVLNSYFAFYDSLPDAAKVKTEQQSGFLHLALNMTFVNLIALILMTIAALLNSESSGLLEFQAHLRLTVILLIVTTLSAYLIYNKRLKYTYARSTELYFHSNDYKGLLERLNKN